MFILEILWLDISGVDTCYPGKDWYLYWMQFWTEYARQFNYTIAYYHDNHHDDNHDNRDSKCFSSLPQLVLSKADDDPLLRDMICQAICYCCRKCASYKSLEFLLHVYESTCTPSVDEFEPALSLLRQMILLQPSNCTILSKLASYVFLRKDKNVEYKKECLHLYERLSPFVPIDRQIFALLLLEN